MVKLYNKIDENLIKKSPFNWVLGWHKFLPIIALLLLLSIGVGFMFPVTTYNYYRNNGLGTASMFLGFISFMTFILFVIRQIKFNSFRIHHHIPFKKHILVFFSFWGILFLFSIIPSIAHHVHDYRVKKHINSITDDFKADTKVLFEGSVFFTSYNDNVIIQETISPSKYQPKISDIFDVVFNENEIQINNVTHNFSYYNSDVKFPITITKKEAITRIQNFIIVADKYNIELTNRNPTEIFNKRLHYSKLKKHTDSYSILTLKNNIDSFSTAENAYDGMMYNYSMKINKKITFYDILIYLLLSILLATLLWVVISVPIEDFGLSVLASVLIMVFMGIVSAIVHMITSVDFYMRLTFYLMIIIVYFFAYFSNIKPSLKRILKIVSHYLVPVFMFLLFLEIEEMEIFEYNKEFYVFGLFVIIGVLISNFIFKNIYKNYRLLPK